MQRGVKWLFGVGSLSCVMALLYYAFQPKPVDADLETVRQGDLRITVDEDGQTRIRERYVISAPLAGRLLRIQLDPGDDAVKNETLLAAIEPGDPALLDPRARAEAQARVKAAEAAKDQAEAELKRAEALRDQATRDRQRLADLAQKHVTSERELRDAETLERVRRQEYTAAQFAEQIAAFQLELAEAALMVTQPSADRSTERRLQIFAPTDGRILRVFQKSAGIVQPGAPLLEFGDPRDLECVIDVLSVDAVRIRPGNAVDILRWGGDHALRGIVRVVEPAAFTKVSALGVEEQRVNVIVDFVDPPEQRRGLGDGYRVDARIVVEHQRDVLKVPSSALFRNGDTWAVYRVTDNHARLTEVKLGDRTDLEAQVIGGLSQGDRVIVHPADGIVDGAAVRLRE